MLTKFDNTYRDAENKLPNETIQKRSTINVSLNL